MKLLISYESISSKSTKIRLKLHQFIYSFAAIRTKMTFSVRNILIVATVLSLAIPARSSQETDDFPIIYDIKIVGNRATKEVFILREMQLVVGGKADPEILNKDRLHLLSLGIFNQVELSIVNDRDRAVILVRVTERFYIYPYPIFRYDPANPSRRIIGITINHYNFRGYAERLSLAWWDGFERGFYLLHRDPWFSIGGRFGLRTQFLQNDMEIIAPDGLAYRAKTESLLLRLRWRIDRVRWIGLESEWEEQSSKGEFYTLSSSGRDRLLIGRIYYEADLRDYLYYPRSGYYFTAILKANRMVDTTHSFYRQQVDFRVYKSAGRFTAALRGMGQTTQNTLPWYRQSELTQLEIRSRTPLGLKGSEDFIVNAEIRFNIVPLRYYSFGEIPLAGRYLQKMKFSVEGLLFLDRGYLKLIDRSRELGFTACGMGFQFQLPYVEVAHALIGWDPETKSRPTLVFATGVTF